MNIIRIRIKFVIMQYFKNLRRFEPRVSFKLNKFIPTNNYSLTHYKGDNYRDMISFATNVQQITLGALYCKFNNYNFYLKPHPYFIDFKIVNKKLDDSFSMFKKKYRFFYFDRAETNYYKRRDFFSNDENDFPIKESEKEKYIDNFHDFNKSFLYKKLSIKQNIEIDEDTLVIHCRTGNIFYGNWNNLYTQNSLNYFLKISQDYKKVILVTGKEHNNPIFEILKKEKKFVFQSNSFIEDFNTLLNAKNLATSGVTAFAMSAALMSQKLKNFYHSDIYLKEHLNPEMLNNKEVNIHSYKILDYLRPGEFVKSEINLQKLLNTEVDKVIKI